MRELHQQAHSCAHPLQEALGLKSNEGSDMSIKPEEARRHGQHEGALELYGIFIGTAVTTHSISAWDASHLRNIIQLRRGTRTGSAEQTDPP